MVRRWSALWWVLGACTGSPTSSAALDSGVSIDAEPKDAAPDPDAGQVDGSPTIAAIELLDGRSVRGELIASYDHRRWWAGAADETTLALFEPSAFATGATDRSLGFYLRSAIKSIEMLPLSDPRPSYRDLLRTRGIVIGLSPIAGAAFVINGNEAYHLDENGYGDFAWDLTVVDADGLTYRGAGLANEDYYVWDREVRAPSSGLILEVVGDAPDRAPGPITDYAAQNNLVGIHLDGGYAVYLLHFRQGSIPPEIQVGARVERGDRLGSVGNSGVTIAPHLHLTVLWWDELAQRYWSVPSELEDVFTSTSSTGGARQAYAVPTSGTWISSAPF